MGLGSHGKHANLSDGSRGIGKAIARGLVRGSIAVAIVVGDKEALEATARKL